MKQRLATMEENARALRAFGIDDDLASMRAAPKELSEEERLARNERRLERLAELQANRRPTSTRVQTLEEQRGAREKEQRKRLAEEHAFFEATERALADADGDRPRKPRSAAAAGAAARRRRRRRSPTRSARAWRRRRGGSSRCASGLRRSSRRRTSTR